MQHGCNTSPRVVLRLCRRKDRTISHDPSHLPYGLLVFRGRGAAADRVISTLCGRSAASRSILLIARIVARRENVGILLYLLSQIQDQENSFDLGEGASIPGDKSGRPGIRVRNIVGPGVHEAIRRFRLGDFPQMRCNRSQVGYVRIRQMKEEPARVVAEKLLKMHLQLLARPFLRGASSRRCWMPVIGRRWPTDVYGLVRNSDIN
jgi:hypothetical protein